MVCNQKVTTHYLLVFESSKLLWVYNGVPRYPVFRSSDTELRDESKSILTLVLQSDDSRGDLEPPREGLRKENNRFKSKNIYILTLGVKERPTVTPGESQRTPVESMNGYRGG